MVYHPHPGPLPQGSGESYLLRGAVAPLQRPEPTGVPFRKSVLGRWNERPLFNAWSRPGHLFARASWVVGTKGPSSTPGADRGTFSQERPGSLERKAPLQRLEPTGAPFRKSVLGRWNERPLFNAWSRPGHLFARASWVVGTKGPSSTPGADRGTFSQERPGSLERKAPLQRPEPTRILFHKGESGRRYGPPRAGPGVLFRKSVLGRWNERPLFNAWSRPGCCSIRANQVAGTGRLESGGIPFHAGVPGRWNRGIGAQQCL